jgi:hypothetical protein
VDSRSAGRSIEFEWYCFLLVEVEGGDALRREKTSALRCTAKEGPESLEERLTEACVDNVCALSERGRGPEHEVTEHWATLSRFRSIPAPERTAEMGERRLSRAPSTAFSMEPRGRTFTGVAVPEHGGAGLLN